MERTIRVVVAKVGLDVHDRGAKIIARALRGAGMEVIYTGLHQTGIGIDPLSRFFRESDEANPGTLVVEISIAQLAM